MKHRLALTFAAICVMTTLLANCQGRIDPEFAALEARALANPAPQSITGMWYRRQSGDVLKDKNTVSYLFKSDGTGMVRFKMGDYFRQDNLTWTYDGQGRWTLSLIVNGTTILSQVRTTGEHLLIYGFRGSKLVLVKSA